MTRYITIAIAIAFGLTLAARPSLAGSADVDPGDIARIAHKLKLTKKQRQQIRNLHDGVRKTNIKLRAEMEATGIDLRRELDQDTPSETKVGGYITKISQLEGSARKARVVSWIRIRKLLSADQRKMLALFNAGKSHYAHSKRSTTRKRMKRELAEIKRELRRAKRLAKHARHNAHGHQQRARIDALKALEKLQKRKLKLKNKSKHIKNPFAKPRFVPKDPNAVIRDPFASRGTMIITANPHAKIYLDGKLMGTTPLRLKLRPGKHHIKSVSRKAVRRTGVTVRAGELTTLRIGD